MDKTKAGRQRAPGKGDGAAAKKQRLTVEEIIQKAVSAARVSFDGAARDAYKATEKRLYAYPVILMRVQCSKDRLAALSAEGAQFSSKSVIRFSKAGQRLTPHEIQEAVAQNLAADIARDENEIEMIDKALEIIQGDPYADIVRHAYFEGKNDEEIAALMECKPVTVWRNKGRLVKRLSVFLYGAGAVA